MKTYINERSLPKNLSSIDEAVEVLEKIVLMAPFALTMSNNQIIRRHRGLANQDILPNTTLIEFIRGLLNDKNRKRADIGSAFLRLFVKGPFIAAMHEEKDTVHDEHGECLKSSCFDEASSHQNSPILLSFQSTPPSIISSYSVKSSKFGDKTLRSFCESGEIEKECWVYEANPKHAIKEDKIVDGVVHSAMRLSDEVAQKVLTSGVMCGSSVFSTYEGTLYKFHSHEKNKFHGFPINIKIPYKDFVTASKILETASPNVDGQIFANSFYV